MGYGLKVKNTAGNIIIDGVYRNFAFYESGSATASWVADGGWTKAELKLVSFASIPDTKIPLIGIQPATNKFINLLGYHKTESNWDGFYICTGVANDGNWEDCTINYKVFVAGLTAAPGVYGIRVYNDINQIVFDSNRKYFSIGEVHSITLNSPVYEAYTKYYEDIIHSSYSDPYYAFSPSGYHHGTAMDNAWIFRIGLKKLSSTSVRVGWNMVWTNPASGIDADWSPAADLIVLTI